MRVHRRFDPAAVFSSIDLGGRYAFGNQPRITQWNLARLAEALLSIIDPDTDAAVSGGRARAPVVRSDRFERYWLEAACGPSSASTANGATIACSPRICSS